MKKILLLSLFVLSTTGAYSQYAHSGIFDVGSSTISSGAYFRPATLSTYQYNFLHGSAGLQWTFSGAERSEFSALSLSAGADLNFKGIPFTADLLFRVNPYSALTKETNLGFLLSHNRQHIDIHLGYHMRSYTLKRSSEEVNDLAPDADLAIREYRNFIYRGRIHLNEAGEQWDIGLSVTNYDHFIIQQETNPLFSLDAFYKIYPSLKINTAIFYQGSGMLNLHPNHYGFYYRIGITWQAGQ
jgi:hypothetical protein